MYMKYYKFGYKWSMLYIYIYVCICICIFVVIGVYDMNSLEVDLEKQTSEENLHVMLCEKFELIRHLKG